MVSTVTWTTFSVPYTLVNVGSEAVCMLCDNILCFMDLRKKEISYYKAESPELGLSIQAITGHNKFSLVAFSEVVLRPSVHIIQYPNFNKYAVFSTQKIITFVDIRFNDYDLLMAISGYPHYTFCIWNFRTGQLLVQHDTLKESSAKSILCSYHHTPQIVQFSEWHREILIWEMCYNATGVDLHEVSKIQLTKEFTFSNISSMCYGEDNRLYVVDNFATVSMVEVASFHLKFQWSVVDAPEVCSDLRRFSLESHKQGLLVYSLDIIYYLRRKHSKWQCEWKLLPSSMPSLNLSKCVSNNNGEIYAAFAVGNLYQVEIFNESVSVNAINSNHENSIDFVIVKGVKEECLLQLTVTNYIKSLAMSRYLLYSKLHIPQANTIVAHNMGPYVMVGTTNGQIHFLNYTNVREPVITASLDTEKSYTPVSLHLLDKMSVYRSLYNDFHLMKTDFAQNIFHEITSLARFEDNVLVRECFLAENNRFFIFINRDSMELLPCAKVMCCYRWFHFNDQEKLETLEFDLPFVYRSVGSLMVPVRNIIEFFAVRVESCILDYLNFKTDTNELVVMHSIKTHHLSNISGIASSINLLTWGVDGTYIHYRTHRKSPRPYGVCQVLQIKYRPRVVQKVLDCFMAKYLVYMYSRGGIKVMRVASSGIPTIENTFTNESLLIVEPHLTKTHTIDQSKVNVIVEHTPAEWQARDELLKEIQTVKQQVTQLINYDMLVTGKSQGIFKKFCLNHKWLTQLTQEAQKLCEIERSSLEAAITDQCRIRDWLYAIITSSNQGITFKLRAIFSHFHLENFGLPLRTKNFIEFFDLYRFYEMDLMESEEVTEEGELTNNQEQPKINYLKVKGTAYEHIMSAELAMQDVGVVTGNQMCNQDAKIRVLLTDRLRTEFNMKFEEIRQIKQDLMTAILDTNNTLTQIYNNINCMLKLLGKSEFKPPKLSVPAWKKDEIVKLIMEVDDSEIKAVNRRKKKAEIVTAQRGRLLLWSLEFWAQALIAMMDGVLEKLWEEEIKKDIPMPEFLTKKEPAEYTLEDQRTLKEYEEKCRLLEEDRKKYLRILKVNEHKTNELKTSYILKLNENVTELMIVKLKYDIAIEHVRLRNFNTKIRYFKKLEWLKSIETLRADINSVSDYIQKYGKLYEFWSKSVEDLRLKVENLTAKQKTIERQFRGQFLNTIPQHLGPEMNKTFKKRPKTSPKLLNSTLICKELSMRVNLKLQPKFPFPLPKDVFEYLEGLNSLDDASNSPVSLESKYWDQFIKLRRQKVEMELKIRAVNLQLADGCAGMNSYGKELANLKSTKTEAILRLQEAQEEYLKSVQDQTLELRLTMGQVELNIEGSLKNLQNCVLMHQDDINDINTLILEAGQRKIKAMQKVAFFRRQVIYKEWEHKVVSANIEYLNNMLYIIGKCKVSIEFLNILRNWQKIKAEKHKLLNTVGLLEKVAEQKLAGHRKEIIKLNEKISQTCQQIHEIKLNNKQVNRQIDEHKVLLAFSERNRDYMIEEKIKREQNEKMEKIKRHSNLIESVRRDYVHIMELKTILELQRLRTYPTLGPNPHHCST